MKPRIMYIELKSSQGGGSDNGPAWIGKVAYSKTGKTLYYRDLRLQRANLVSGNHIDLDTGDEYWVSGPKKNGQDRYPWTSAPVEIDEDIREEYWSTIRGDPSRAHQALA